MNFDDMQEDDDQPTGSVTAPSEGGALPSFDDMPAMQDFDSMPGEEVTSSPMGAVLRRGLIEAPAGLVGGVAGIGAGAAAGGAAGLATANPIVGAGAAIGAGVPAAMYAGSKTHDLEMWLLDKLGLREGTGFFSEAQEAADRMQHPYATFGGELAGNILPTMGTGIGSGIRAGTRAFGGALQGGMEASQEAWNDEDLDPAKIAGAAAAGAVFAKPHGFVPGGGHFNEPPPQAPAQGSPAPQTPGSGPIAGALPPPGTRTMGRNPGVVQGDPYTNPGRDVLARTTVRGPTTEGGPVANVDQPEPIYHGNDLKEGEVLPPEPRPVIAEDPDVAFAREQRDTYDPGDPMYQFWNEHMNTVHQEEARWGPPVDGDFGYTTPEDMSRANDVTTVSVGIAHENSPAPEVRGAGNPVGAPMQARIASRPSEPGRDYRKPNEIATTDKGTTSGQFHPDILQAMTDSELTDALNKAPPAEGQYPWAQSNETRNLPEPAHQTEDNLIGQHRDMRAAEANTIVKQQAQNGGEAFQEIIPPKRHPSEMGPGTQMGLGDFQGHLNENGEPAGRADTSGREPGIPMDFDDEGHPIIEGDSRQVGSMRELSHAEDLAQRGFRETGDAAYLDRKPPVTAAVTEPPPELAKYPKVVEGIRSKLPAEQHAAAYAKAVDLLGRHEKAAYDAGEGARHTVTVGDKTVQTGGGKRGARKEQAIAAWGKAYDSFGPGSGMDLPETIKEAAPLARRIMEYATEANGGEDPIKSYKPQKPPAQWKWLRAVQNLANKPSAKYFEELKAAHALGGETGERIDAELAKKRRPDLDKLQVADTTEPYHERVVHKTFDNSLGDESQVFKTQHDRLTNWLNTLSDGDYHTVSALNDHALDRVLDKTQDPQETMANLMQDLAGAQRKNPPRLDWGAEDGAVTKKTPIKTAADVKAIENPGRVLDKNSPEFKRIAAEALARTPKKSLDLAGVEQAERRAYGADIPKDPDAPVVDGSDKTALEHWARFLADEGGAVPMDRLLRNMADWMKTNVKDFFTPRADPHVLEYGNQIGMSGTKLNTDLTRIKLNAIAAARTAVDANGDVPMPAEMRQMYEAKENKALHTLPQRLRDYYNAHAQVYIDRAGLAYDELRDISTRLKMPGWAQMPERKVNSQPGTADWIPRRLLRNADDESFEPIGNRGLSNWAESAQERDWFTLHNLATGERKVYHVNKDDNMVFYQNHNAGRARTPPASFDPRDIGAQLTQRGGQTWIVDHAKTAELMAHANGENGKPLQYTQNPVYAALNSYIGLKSALTRMQLLDRYLNDPDFQNLSTTRRSEAVTRFGEGNFAESILPQLKGRYMPKPVAWAFDDMVKSGFNYGDNKFMNGLARFTQATLKPFYFLGPEVHVLNELDKFLIGRGWDNVLPKGVTSGVRNFAKAMHSVRMQDATQAEIMDAGGNPMFAHAAAARALPQIAKTVGEDLAARSWKYDPLMKMFGTNTREVMSELYQKSNKAMWWQSDVLYTTLYNEAREQGMSPKDAVKHTEGIIDSYVVPSTMGKSMGIKEGSDMGRTVQQFMTDPVWSNFGRFHYGVYKMAGTIVKNLLGPNSTPAQRVQGAGQAAMLLAMGNIVYPALSAAYQKVTGNEHSEVEKRGLSRLVGTATDIAKGNKDPGEIMRNVWSPSTVIDTALRAHDNKDFRGKPILDASGGWGRVPGQAAEFAAGQMVSPYKTLSTAAQQGGPGWVGQRFLESNLGLKTPSEGAIKYEANLPKTWKRNATTRERHPNGVIEGLVNSIVGR